MWKGELNLSELLAALLPVVKPILYIVLSAKKKATRTKLSNSFRLESSCISKRHRSILQPYEMPACLLLRKASRASTLCKHTQHKRVKDKQPGEWRRGKGDSSHISTPHLNAWASFHKASVCSAFREFHYLSLRVHKHLAAKLLTDPAVEHEQQQWQEQVQRPDDNDT